MFRKIVAIWVSLAMLFGLVVIVDVVTDITPPVKAATITVDDSGGADYKTIQEGIDAANPGDTVHVNSGTYNENVLINKTINLTGNNKADTIIQGELSGHVVWLTADHVNFTGFTVVVQTIGFDTGVKLDNVNNCSIINNSIMAFWFDTHYCIYIYRGENNSIRENEISARGDAIFIEDSIENIIAGNTILGGGIDIFGDTVGQWNTHEIAASNTVNHKPVFYLKNQIGGAVPPGKGQVILANCSNVLIENQVINDTSIGIHLGFSKNNTLTRNNVFETTRFGIGLFSSHGNKLDCNNVSYNNMGMYVSSSNENNISANNLTSNSGYSIYLVLSNETNLENNNIFSNSDDGICMWNSHANTIIGNNASDNIYGISLHSSTDNYIISNSALFNFIAGISLVSSDGNRIIGNNASFNDQGLRFDLSDRNNISKNEICSNEDYGILFLQTSIKNNITNNNIINNYIGFRHSSSTNNNKIFHNNFIGNTYHAMDATNFDNQWDDGYPSGGNFWSDYGGVDYNSTPTQDIPPPDGIGDTPYVIDPDSQDNYPLMNPIGNCIFLHEGWNLISIPFIQSDTNLSQVLSPIQGSYNAVQWYNATDHSDPWKHKSSLKPLYLNDLEAIDHTMGFWVHITQPNGSLFKYPGTQPSSNQSITLHPGWNMVGYPSLSNKNRTDALNNIIFDQDVDAIWTFNAATQIWQEISPTDSFELGRGYWIHSKVTKTWDVPL